ncbi:MAG TPA: hypothetical protein VI256_01820, partial [Roseiarcus sp.]
ATDDKPNPRHAQPEESLASCSAAASTYRRAFLLASHSRSNSSTIPDTFRPSSMAAILAALIRPSSTMTISGFLPDGARGPLLLFSLSATVFLVIASTDSVPLTIMCSIAKFHNRIAHPRTRAQLT